MPENTGPMSPDELSQLDDIPDRSDPPHELSVPRLFVTPTSRAGSGSELAAGHSPPVDLRAVKPEDGDVTGWQISSEVELTSGISVASTRAASLPTEAADMPDELPPSIPEWSGVAYLPRAAAEVAPQAARVLRRRSGRRVRPEYVFGKDDRVVYNPVGYPWRCIGRIFVYPKKTDLYPSWSGTAALIWKTAILTCSHMVPWASGFEWKARFVAGYYDGVSVNGPGGAAWVTGHWGYQNHSQGDDMAVLALDAPLGSWLGYFGYKTYTDQWEDEPWWTLCGYPGDVAGAQRPSRQQGFPITDDDYDGAGLELEYDADSSPGNSGGPVFGWFNNPPQPYVIGTHSGGEEEVFDKSNVAAGGPALSSLINWARTNW